MALWTLQNFKKEGSQVSSKNLIVSIGVSRDAKARWRVGSDKNGTYVENVNHLLNSYATNVNIAKSSFEISMFMKIHNALVVQIADARYLKAVRYEKAYPDEQIKAVLIDVLPTAICVRCKCSVPPLGSFFDRARSADICLSWLTAWPNLRAPNISEVSLGEWKSTLRSGCGGSCKFWESRKNP